jgi:hypothetical protein
MRVGCQLHAPTALAPGKTHRPILNIKNEYKNLVWETWREETTKKTASSCEDNSKMNVKGAGCETVNLIRLAQDGV